MYLLVFNRVYGLEIESTMLVFSTQLYELTTLYLNRFRTYKIAKPSKAKT